MSRMKRNLIVLAILAFGCALTSEAHHSLTDYDMTQRVRLEATVREFQFINPHPFLVLEVTRGGNKERWRAEMDNRNELDQAGVTTATFKRGDPVIVSGNPARSDSRRIYLRRLDRPSDGFWYEQEGDETSIRKPK
jgi:hypothetical protein